MVSHITRNLTLEEKTKANYLSAVVLGLNDAIVEFTGALAGFTILLQKNELIILAGLTTGIAATLSMGAAEFLSQKTGSSNFSPRVAALCTGAAYLVTVVLLLAPYGLLSNPFTALICCLVIAGMIIFVYTLIAAKMLEKPFWTQFLQMLSISFVVAGIAFSLSWLAKTLWGINV